jgi:hypothetical protein
MTTLSVHLVLNVIGFVVFWLGFSVLQVTLSLDHAAAPLNSSVG